MLGMHKLRVSDTYLINHKWEKEAKHAMVQGYTNLVVCRKEAVVVGRVDQLQ